MPGMSARSSHGWSTRASSQSRKPTRSPSMRMFAAQGSPWMTVVGPVRDCHAERHAVTAEVGIVVRSTSPPRSTVSRARVPGKSGRGGQSAISSWRRRSSATTGTQSVGSAPGSQRCTTRPSTCERPSREGTTVGTTKPWRPRWSRRASSHFSDAVERRDWRATRSPASRNTSLRCPPPSRDSTAGEPHGERSTKRTHAPDRSPDRRRHP
jgi:hypothetical protein